MEIETNGDGCVSTTQMIINNMKGELLTRFLETI